MTIEFKESQNWRSKTVLVLLLIPSVFIFYKYGIKNFQIVNLLTGAAILLLACLIILSARLNTCINENGLTYSFPPLIRNDRTIKWTEIEHIYLRNYDAIWEYGGYGWRWALFGKGKAYTINGVNGIQIDLKNGKKILIGTGLPDEAEKVFSHYYKIHHQNT